MSLRTNGRPKPEVIVNFSDGCAYSKGKLEEAFLPGGILHEPPAKPSKEPQPTASKEHVDLIVNQFEIPRHQAEKALTANDGDLQATLKALIGF